MKYDFNIKEKDIKGKGTDRTVGEIVCEWIGTESKGETKEITMKMYHWYRTLLVGDPLELDDVDRSTLVRMVENTDRIWISIKGQILDILK